MKQKGKVILLIFAAILVIVGMVYVLVVRGTVQVQLVPGARTLYSGYVEIEPVSTEAIKTKLEQLGCGFNTYSKRTNGEYCMYEKAKEPENFGEIINVYANGPTFGPSGFEIAEDRVWAGKDIPGPPNPEKFKEEVRQDVQVLGSLVVIKENSWKITEMKYPWTVIY